MLKIACYLFFCPFSSAGVLRLLRDSSGTALDFVCPFDTASFLSGGLTLFKARILGLLSLPLPPPLRRWSKLFCRLLSPFPDVLDGLGPIVSYLDGHHPPFFNADALEFGKCSAVFPYSLSFLFPPKPRTSFVLLSVDPFFPDDFGPFPLFLTVEESQS